MNNEYWKFQNGVENYFSMGAFQIIPGDEDF